MPEPSRLFLLSPANLTGVRAKQLTSPRAAFTAAERYRSPEGVAIAEAFSFMSALYFRGKITYARRFAPDERIRVITPGFGLVDPEWRLHAERMKKLRRVAVDLRSRSYRRPLEQHARELASTVGADCRVILLGSIATGKYVDVLWPIFGEQLLFPSSFVGIGDMSRGALMLRAARAGEELEYSTLDVPRHRPKARLVILSEAGGSGVSEGSAAGPSSR